MSLDIPSSLNYSKNKIILLRMKENGTVRGVLQSFDIHLNLVLNDAEDVSNQKVVKLGKILVRGDSLFAISLPDK